MNSYEKKLEDSLFFSSLKRHMLMSVCVCVLRHGDGFLCSFAQESQKRRMERLRESAKSEYLNGEKVCAPLWSREKERNTNEMGKWRETKQVWMMGKLKKKFFSKISRKIQEKKAENLESSKKKIFFVLKLIFFNFFELRK